MRKTLLTLLSVTVIAFAGCKKDSSTNPSGSGTYFPVTKGSTWTYSDVSGGVSDTRSLTLTGTTTQINGKTYYNLDVESQNNGSETSYVYAADHAYALRLVNDALSLTIEVQLGNDNQNAGYTWTTQPTDDGTVDGFPAKLINTIKEKGISKTVNGKKYDNVIHTQAQLQYDTGSGYETAGTYDFYLAQGVGLISESLAVSGSVYETETLTGYTIK